MKHLRGFDNDPGQTWPDPQPSGRAVRGGAVRGAGRARRHTRSHTWGAFISVSAQLTGGSAAGVGTVRDMSLWRSMTHNHTQRSHTRAHTHIHLT